MKLWPGTNALQWQHTTGKNNFCATPAASALNYPPSKRLRGYPSRTVSPKPAARAVIQLALPPRHGSGQVLQHPSVEAGWRPQRLVSDLLLTFHPSKPCLQTSSGSQTASLTVGGYMLRPKNLHILNILNPEFLKKQHDRPSPIYRRAVATACIIYYLCERISTSCRQGV